MSVKQGGNTIAGGIPENTLNYDNITNCITEIPQDIKLELNNGTLTLKAGSKVYVPNGSGVFDTVTVASDINLIQGWGTVEKCALCVYGGNALAIMSSNRCASGSSDSISGNDHWYYNTTDNTIRFINSDGTARTAKFSMPIAIITMAGNNANVSRIDQVFNGFGYIGSTVFALPNVKGLIPNGRNKDGTLKNIEVTTSVVAINSGGGANQQNIYYGLNELGQIALNGLYSYDYINNVVYDGTTISSALFVDRFDESSGQIVNFDVPTPFHAVDRNDGSWVAEQAMPSGRHIDLTLGASDAKYKAPANGWFMLQKHTSGANQYILIQNEISGLVDFSVQSVYPIRSYIPCYKGDSVRIEYSAGGETLQFIFIYAEGDK